jgi:hypothetical protein
MKKVLNKFKIKKHFDAFILRTLNNKFSIKLVKNPNLKRLIKFKNFIDKGVKNVLLKNF